MGAAMNILRQALSPEELDCVLLAMYEESRDLARLDFAALLDLVPPKLVDEKKPEPHPEPAEKKDNKAAEGETEPVEEPEPEVEKPKPAAPVAEKKPPEKKEDYEENFEIEEEVGESGPAKVQQKEEKKPAKEIEVATHSDEIKESIASQPAHNEKKKPTEEPAKENVAATHSEEIKESIASQPAPKEEKKAAPAAEEKSEDQYAEELEKMNQDKEEKSEPVEAEEKNPEPTEPAEKPKEKLQPQSVPEPDRKEGEVDKEDHEEAAANADAEAEEKEEEMNIDEDKMIEIAQNCFQAIAERMLQQKKTIKGLYGSSITRQDVDGENIEVITTDDFVSGIESLGVAEFRNVDYACLVKALSISDDQKLIKVSDLAQILTEYGIVEGEGKGKEGGAEKPSELQQEAKEEDKKKRRLQLKFDDLDQVSMVLMLALTEYLIKTKMPLYDLFAEAIYQQVVKTKSKQKTVELINSSDFFGILCKIGIKMEENEHENLKKFLCLDPHYMDKVYVKKLKAAVEEFAFNEELRAIAQNCYKALIDEEKDDNPEAQGEEEG